MADIAEERNRIARELHDGIAQELAAIGYALDSEIGRSDTTVASRSALREIREQITALNSVVRKEIFQLRSLREDSAQQLLVNELTNLELDFNVVGSLPSTEAGIQLAKVVVELSRNASQHGRASHISIDIREKQIAFESDGESAEPVRDPRFGLLGISERLESIGWTITLKSDFTRIELREEI